MKPTYHSVPAGMDPGRGSFHPVNRAPKGKGRKEGPRHPGKTAQDRMAVAKRPRVEAAQKRRSANQKRVGG